MPDASDRLRDTFLDLVRIPSPSRAERRVADAVRNRIEERGYSVEEDEAAAAVGGNANNLLVRVPGTHDLSEAPPLLLVAHLDTVESGETPIVPKVEGDLVTAEGETIVGADDTCGVTVLLELLARLREETRPHRPLRVLFTVAEEVELLGAKALPDAWLEGVAAGVALDHGDPAEVVTGAPGKVALRITVHGVGGHGAFPLGRINAARALATAVARLSSGRLDAVSTANLGILRAGTAINVIPETAYAEYEIRSHRTELLDAHLEDSLAAIEAAVREARVYLADPDADAAGDPLRKATVEVEVERCYEPFRRRGDDSVVADLLEAMEAAGATPGIVLGQGGSDANVLNLRGVPAVVLGCGMHGAHSSRERACLSEMARAVEIALRLASAARTDSSP